MDPDAVLAKAREALSTLRTRDDIDSAALDDLLDAFEALDAWLSRGGFPPKDWRLIP